MEFRLVPNQSGKSNYNRNLIQKIFLCVYIERLIEVWHPFSSEKGLSSGILFSARDQRGGQMDTTLGLSAGRSGVRIPGRGRCLLGTTPVDARVNYPLLP